jgi:hypothetical protein
MSFKIQYQVAEIVTLNYARMYIDFYRGEQFCDDNAQIVQPFGKQFDTEEDALQSIEGSFGGTYTILKTYSPQS